MPLLSFISDDALNLAAKKVLDEAQLASDQAEERFFSNVLDPFSAVFDTLRQGITLEEWKKQEQSRQIQKTLQNALGNFHQEIIGSMSGWENLPVGNNVDVRNMQRKIVAEVKNKYNTTKGNHKIAIYDELLFAINSEQYNDFVSYYVEIVPSKKEPYDKPFVPSDATTHQRRSENPNIRVIDGKSFYHMASGNPNALEELYRVLPDVIYGVIGKKNYDIARDPIFEEFFSSAY